MLHTYRGALILVSVLVWIPVVSVNISIGKNLKQVSAYKILLLHATYVWFIVYTNSFRLLMMDMPMEWVKKTTVSVSISADKFNFVLGIRSIRLSVISMPLPIYTLANY